MKKVIIIALSLILGMSAFAQPAPDNFDYNHPGFSAGTYYGVSFLDGKKMPDMTKFLPAPPAEKDELYHNDVEKYKWGKSLRGTLRGDTAVWDARMDIPYYMWRFGLAIGKNVTQENCPNLAILMRGILQDIRLGSQNAKDTYHRHRPYQVFKEPSATPASDKATEYNSYPSGHGVRAWGLAMFFVALDPAHQNAIMKTGYDMGQSRIITGHHFESDLEAARLCASASFARICAEPVFWAYMELVRKELEELKSL